MYCKKCGKQIPDDSNVCSYCGIPIKMRGPDPAKKRHGCLYLIIGFFALVMVFGVVANITGHNKGASTNGESSSVQQEKRAYKIGETFKSNAFEITITGKDATKRVNDKSGYLHSDADGIFVVVHVHYKNVAKSAKSLDSSAFKLKADGKEYSPSILAVRMNENVFHSTINPEIEKDGEIYFDVPENVAKSNLTLSMSSSFISDNFNGEVELF
jgi:predicted nucleic acid-binding Zn ribbon protein